ncbi:hypothetical protein [Achromobacter xylosoxidans]|uniref:hypothetical protein n=1 Tax=Alcaligenes xylosoxydans xylosoxydans TaxID=85698 RepID=UPI000A41994C|nr:hypothetical protein [Achromobacter xylosoxidans]
MSMRRFLKRHPALEHRYNGNVCFLYSSKISESVDLERACRILVKSDAFNFALCSRGALYYRSERSLACDKLLIDQSLDGRGSSVIGLDKFLACGPTDAAKMGVWKALHLLNSDSKFSNDASSFPVRSVRIQVSPVAIRLDGDDAYSLCTPMIRLYEDGTISVLFELLHGFEERSVAEIVSDEVNAAMRGIKSFQVNVSFYRAALEQQFASMPLAARWHQFSAFKRLMQNAPLAPESFELGDDEYQLVELVLTDRLSLSDIARNIILMIERSLDIGKVPQRPQRIAKQWRSRNLSGWFGKPVLIVSSHEGQLQSAARNAAKHRLLINSVMMRSHPSAVVGMKQSELSDLRPFDDFNHYFSEGVSLVLCAGKVSTAARADDSVVLENIIADTLVLTEAAQFLQVFYSAVSDGLDGCNSSTDVARLELKLMSLEESFFNGHRFGETQNFFNSVRSGARTSGSRLLVQQKLDVARKALDLSEKISSDHDTRWITLTFGVLASAALSPELVQPIATVGGWHLEDESLFKVICLLLSFVLVGSLLGISRLIIRFLSRRRAARSLKQSGRGVSR